MGKGTNTVLDLLFSQSCGSRAGKMSVSKMPLLKPEDLSLDVQHPCKRMHVMENHMTLPLEKQKQEGPWDF